MLISVINHKFHKSRTDDAQILSFQFLLKHTHTIIYFGTRQFENCNKLILKRHHQNKSRNLFIEDRSFFIYYWTTALVVERYNYPHLNGTLVLVW